MYVYVDYGLVQKKHNHNNKQNIIHQNRQNKTEKEKGEEKKAKPKRTVIIKIML